MLLKCCPQCVSKFRKLSSGHRTGKCQFSFQSLRKTMPKNVQTTEQLHSSHTLAGEGNGNPLQCFCLENPRDGGARWAAVYGVAQSRTRLKRLSSTHSPGKEMAPHSSTLAWKIPCTEEPGRLQSMGSQRVGHDWATSLSLFTFMHWRRKWQPTPVFLPEDSQGLQKLVHCYLWGRTELDMTEAT